VRGQILWIIAEFEFDSMYVILVLLSDASVSNDFKSGNAATEPERSLMTCGRCEDIESEAKHRFIT
jgi:hypothetical protein